MNEVKQLDPGTVVRMKSRAKVPMMTVQEYDKDGKAVCVWFSEGDGEVRGGSFVTDSLTVVKLD